VDSNWTIVYSTTADYVAEMLNQFLFDNDIESVIVNKKDSAYICIGEIELYVQLDNAMKAKHLIKKFFDSEQLD